VERQRGDDPAGERQHRQVQVAVSLQAQQLLAGLPAHRLSKLTVVRGVYANVVTATVRTGTLLGDGLAGDGQPQLTDAADDEGIGGHAGHLRQPQGPEATWVHSTSPSSARRHR
jgi:hypothetical protein